MGGIFGSRSRQMDDVVVVIDPRDQDAATLPGRTQKSGIDSTPNTLDAACELRGDVRDRVKIRRRTLLRPPPAIVDYGTIRHDIAVNAAQATS